MTDFKISIEGTADMLMHNSRLANPLDPAAKALRPFSKKRVKTDDDYESLARLEHAGGMYFDPDVGPYLPSDNIWRALYDGAKKHKLGVKVKEGIFFPEQVNPLAYKGPRTVDGLWRDENFRLIASVVIGRQRVMRTRPMFRSWATEAVGILDDDALNFDELQLIARTAGEVIGLGDWRPRFGRFKATVTKIKK